MYPDFNGKPITPEYFRDRIAEQKNEYIAHAQKRAKVKQSSTPTTKATKMVLKRNYNPLYKACNPSGGVTSIVHRFEGIAKLSAF